MKNNVNCFWIARDKDKSLHLFYDKPRKFNGCWCGEKIDINDNLFKDIVFDDIEPTPLNIHTVESWKLL